MIDVKEAVKNAREFAIDMLGNPQNLELEEVELSDDERYWLVTLGFDGKEIDSLYRNALVAQPRRRKYRVFSIRCDDGKVKSMKFRAASTPGSQQ